MELTSGTCGSGGLPKLACLLSDGLGVVPRVVNDDPIPPLILDSLYAPPYTADDPLPPRMMQTCL